MNSEKSNCCYNSDWNDRSEDVWGTWGSWGSSSVVRAGHNIGSSLGSWCESNTAAHNVWGEVDVDCGAVGPPVDVGVSEGCGHTEVVWPPLRVGECVSGDVVVVAAWSSGARSVGAWGAVDCGPGCWSVVGVGGASEENVACGELESWLDIEIGVLVNAPGSKVSYYWGVSSQRSWREWCTAASSKGVGGCSEVSALGVICAAVHLDVELVEWWGEWGVGSGEDLGWGSSNKEGGNSVFCVHLY